MDTDTKQLERACDLLAERFDEDGQHAATALRQWLSGDIPLACHAEIAQHLEDEHLDLLFDAFWQTLPFGTGGRRGRVGYGPNRINFALVAMTAQGHCNYLRQQHGDRDDLSVVVANDVRVFKDIAQNYAFLGGDHPLLDASSRSFARLCCEVYAGNGIRAYLGEPESDDAVVSTPMLSYVLGQLDAVGGINFSASHNPPDDNGIKVYDSYGSQPVAPDDQHLADAMGDVRDVNTISFDEARSCGLIEAIPEELTQSYMDVYRKHYANVYTPTPSDPVIVYSPLCGCGLTTAGAVLEDLGFPLKTPPDQGPDGTFAAIPLKAPNPEVAQSTQPAKDYADEVGSRIVLCSDPDADRIGMEAKLDDDEWYHFDGNQLAAMLTYFLMLDPEGPQRRGLVIETVVTTRLIGKIVEEAGDSYLVDDLLVGFKYVADVLKKLDADGRYGEISCSSADLVIASEESHGILVIPTIRDKDSTPACMYLAALYEMTHRQGRTLLDYYAHILEELGEFDNVGRSIMMAGAAGTQRKEHMMKTLRNAPPKTMGGLPVTKVVDYWDETQFGPFKSATDRLPRNVLQIHTTASVVTIRPSGTEPKIKLYVQLLPSGERSSTTGRELLNEVRRKAEALSAQNYNDLLAIIGLNLSEPALRLPDIVDLDRKVDFQNKLTPALHAKFEEEAFSSLEKDLLPWLSKQAAAMTPGADPLPAVRDALALLCIQWQDDLAGKACFADFAHWTGANLAS